MVVFPRIAGDTGTWPLHLLASAAVEALPRALRLLAAKSSASEALPSPETLQVRGCEACASIPACCGCDAALVAFACLVPRR